MFVEWKCVFGVGVGFEGGGCRVEGVGWWVVEKVVCGVGKFFDGLRKVVVFFLGCLCWVGFFVSSGVVGFVGECISFVFLDVGGI